MIAFDHKFASSWAGLFGFVPVSLFGPSRSAGEAGDHFVLLDGRRSSLTFSYGNASALLATRKPAEWAWSANVPRSVVVDEQSGTVYAFRWDRPTEVRDLRNVSTESVAKMLATMESTEPEAQTSVRRALAIFRTVRQEVREYGGTDLDATGAFNLLLMLADRMRNDANFPFTRELVAALAALRLSGYRAPLSQPFSTQVLTLPIGDLAQDLLRDQSGLSLYPHLLVRHASGTLFQEAHTQLSRPAIGQISLFLTVRSDLARPTGESRPDIHYTPTALARFLSELAINEYLRLNPVAASLTALDPACGSGVFLVEALRELEAKSLSVTVQGVDSSPISKAMADFAVSAAADDLAGSGGSVRVNIEIDNSLKRAWNNPDVVLMNPPFLPWRRIDTSLRNELRESLGSLFHGHADAAIAFFAKAAKELRTGAVVATVLPATMLHSKSASKLRKYLSSPEWQIVMIGRIRGYGYFPSAIVEPAFVVVSKISPQTERRPTRTFIAESNATDEAIRAARISSRDIVDEKGRWELGNRMIISPNDWTPRPATASAMLGRFADSNGAVRRAPELFKICLGIRTGENSVFKVDGSLLARMSGNERAFFRPLADSMRRGQILKDKSVFYPYENGELAIATERELRELVPIFYESRLAPNEKKLKERLSLRDRKWWELVEPRTTWLRFGMPRIMSTTFGRRGSFGLDQDGAHAIIQGHAWLWRRWLPSDEETWHSYLAILNSPPFEAIVDYFGARTQGGQYELAPRFLQNVPLPDISTAGKTLRNRLAEHGRAIRHGKRISLYSLSTDTVAAYGVSPDEFYASFPLTTSSRVEVDFERLASTWKKETEGMSLAAQRLKHPAMNEILGMGELAIPLILRELIERPAWWFAALKILTGADPVPTSARGDLRGSALAWIAWGKENGYLQ